jgi:hypothetical protein
MISCEQIEHGDYVKFLTSDVGAVYYIFMLTEVLPLTNTLYDCVR